MQREKNSVLSLWHGLWQCNHGLSFSWSCHFSPQWPDLQSECWEWQCIPHHLLSLCPRQSWASHPSSGSGPQTLGQGKFLAWWPVKCLSVSRFIWKTSPVRWHSLWILPVLAAGVDLSGGPCRWRRPATIHLCPLGYLLLTAAQTASVANLLEPRGIYFVSS